MDDHRLRKFQKELEFPCFIEEPKDLFYLTGMHFSKGRLFVTPQEALLFVDARYYMQAKEQVPCSVLFWEEQKKIREKKVAFDSATVTYESYLSMQKWEGISSWIPKPSPLKNLRSIKEPIEIDALKKAAELTRKGIEKVQHLLKEAVSEQTLALEFEIFCRKQGASSLSFDPIIAFGEKSAYPHYRAGSRILHKQEHVLVDVGAVVDHYHGDMTRVFHFGTMDERILHLEALVRKAQELALSHIKAGVKVGKLDQVVHDFFEEENVKQLYTHSLGHGIGLDTHEFPRIRFDGEDKDCLLEAGMVLTIEPGLYQVGLGGIRIEDMILVTQTGYIKL